MSAEARCQANRGINAAVFRKQKKEYDSFRFLKLFCVHFCWDGTLGLFPNLTNKHLPVKKNDKKRTYEQVRSAVNNKRGTSISRRAETVEKREEFGHWEMDKIGRASCRERV